jgi:glycoprotein-N-acetylgalactosamine 3-beta-galactosyltransferase
MMKNSSSRRHPPTHRRLFRVSLLCRAAFFLLLGGIYLWISFSLAAIDDVPRKSTPTRHDPFYVKNHHSFSFSPSNTPGVCDVPPGQGEEGPAGIQALYKLKTANNNNYGPVPKVRIFCMVYTHSNRHDVLRAIVETYAPQCDGFLAASNVTDPTLGAWNIPHFGPESYDNMWNKVQAMWFYVHQNFLLEFDWFHIGGDDMYVIPDNLRRMVVDAEFTQTAPKILGGSIPNSKNPKRRYCGGGAGYTLNRRALHLAVQRFAGGECPAESASDEDVRMSRCLEDVGVKCADTNDNAQEARYHHLDAQFHAAWVPTRNSVWLWEKLQYFHNIRGNQTKLAQISNTSVSFHLDKTIVRSLARDRGIRRYHAILYDKCGADFANQVSNAATCSKEERDEMNTKWKRVPKASENS